jgi:hypothetical protein
VDTISPITAVEILDEVIRPIEPTFAPDFAQMLLRLHLSDASQRRIRELLQRNNAGTITSSEKVALEKYLLVGQFLDILQAKARASLRGRDLSP